MSLVIDDGDTSVAPLYELSLSIGRSLDLETLCQDFLDLLVQRQRLDFAAVWIEADQLPDEPTSSGFQLIFALPDSRAQLRQLPVNHASLRFATGQTLRVLSADKEGFQQVVAERDIDGGAYALLRLGEFGLLKLYSATAGALDRLALARLGPIVDRFAVALLGGLAHRRAVAEAEARKSVQRTLEQERALLRSLIDSVPDLISIKDRNGVYLGCNRAFEDYAGRAEVDLIGSTDLDLFALEQARKVADTDRQVLANGSPQRTDQWLEYPDGRGALLDTITTPYRDPHGRTRGLIGISRDISEQHRARQDQRDSEARFRELAEQVRAIPWEAPLEKLRYTYVGPQAQEMLGYPLESWLEPHFWQDHLHPEDRLWAPNFYAERAAETDHFELDYRLIADSGAVVWLRDIVSVVEDSAGPRVLRGIMFDITERKVAEIQLRDYERIVAVSGEYLALIDWEYRLRVINDTFAKALGHTPQQALGQHVADLVGAEMFEQRVRPLFDQALGGQPAFAEDWWDWPEAGRQFFSVHLWPVRRDDGSIDGVAINGIDLTERRLDEERLRQAAVVFESTAEGVIILDTRYRVTRVNRAFVEITGFEPSECRGESLEFMDAGRHGTDEYRQILRALRREGRWQGELWARRKGGELFPLWGMIGAVRDRDGRISDYVAVFSDISEFKRSKDQLDFLAHHDSMTGLPNRLLLSNRLKHALARAKRRSTRVAVLFLDLDRFKNINDSLGHPVGDELLVAVANRLSTRLREEDTLARLGGDEFTVLLEGLERPDDAAEVAADILKTLHMPFDLPSGHNVFIDTSIGISIYPEDGDDCINLIRNADAAMYLAKQQGRGTYRFYTEDMTDAARERLGLETALRQAAELGQLRLDYQPQYELSSGRIVAVEALVRWHDSVWGEVPPERFIPLAEETGLINRLGDWVLDQACADLDRWRRLGYEQVRMAVNVSARQLERPKFVGRIEKLLKRYRLPPGTLELELTETGIMSGSERGSETLQALEAIGVSLAVDDFGTGYSSLAYLKRLSVDRLKIDRSFIQDIPKHADDAEIAATIIAMARQLKLSVVAEGVETEAQEAFLRLQGCELVQGFYYSPALPIEALLDLLASSAEPQPRPSGRSSD